ncbi:mycobacterium membrane protein [Mycolicibacterium chubuense NBB4]|uniref:Mycobacterium membrane protein n=1 Tax=Mycolicibacterium chubuense (strain NBB4) TaxID=710421 RepID=I4BLD6_MYCCN|nr:MmpS family transport accessory protein [Mycolicibacterium chubuense]AFM18093.1 mycobacterium membrane protein [Mycolicibacterium chubuense NBB4]
MTTARIRVLVPLAVAAAGAAGVAVPALADPALPYGPDTCIQGYVWREARDGDTVCVTPDVRARTLAENANPAANKSPAGGAYGPDTCLDGFVWREAFDGDTICVTPGERAQTKADNAAAASRYQANAPKPTPTAATVTFEVTGSGTVYSIDTDPATARAPEDTPLPWSRSVTVGPDVHLLQVVAVGKTASPGCRITLNGNVVAQKPVGGDAHCIFTIPD